MGQFVKVFLTDIFAMFADTFLMLGADADNGRGHVGKEATATGVLLSVSDHTILRLDVLAGYPTAICRFCRRWFLGDFLQSCCSFLSEDDFKLDVGFSLPFRAIVLTHGSDVQCGNWLASDPVQFLFGRGGTVLVCTLPRCRAQGQPREAMVGVEHEPYSVG